MFKLSSIVSFAPGINKIRGCAIRIQAKNQNEQNLNSKVSSEKTINELAKLVVSESDAVGGNSLSELKQIKNSFNGLTSKIELLIQSNEVQTRLSAIQILNQIKGTGNVFFYNHVYFYKHVEHGYADHDDLVFDLIDILLGFNANYRIPVSNLRSTKRNDDDIELREFIQSCIHKLTGVKPSSRKDSDGDLCFYR